MAQQIDSTKLGQLAAAYAPDVPLEVIGAVFKTESGYGSNPAAYQPNSDGAIGAGQILSKALGAKYGNFETYYPGGDPLNPEHSSVAAMRKINNDWGKSGGSIEKFAPLYFGKLADKHGNTAQNHYIPELLKAIQGQANDNQYKNLVAGAVGGTPLLDMGTPSATLSENRIADRLVNGVPQPSTGPVPLNQEDTYATATTSMASQLIEKIMGGQAAIAVAKTDVERAEADTKVELAKQTEALLSQFGLNINETGSEIQLTAAALKQGIGKLRQDQERLMQDRANPIFNVFDTVTGGKMSIVQRQNIAQSTDMVQSLSAGLALAQERAAKQIALQPNVSASAMEKEIQAKAKFNQVQGDLQAGKVGLQEYVRLEKAQAKAEVDEMRMQLQTASLDIRKAQLEINQARLTMPKALTFSEQAKVDSQKAEEELFLDTAKAMGMSGPDYVKFVTKNKDLAGYMVGSDGKLPIPLVVAKANLGKLTPAQKKLFDSAYGQFNGWTSPSNIAGQSIPGMNYTPAETEEVLKSAKTGPQKSEAKQAIIQAIAEKKRDFILNNGKVQDEQINPYVANFGRVTEMAKLPEFVKLNPVVDKVSRSILYTTLQQKNSTNSFDKQGVGDEELLKHASQLVKEGKMNQKEAAMQVSDYYTAQVAMNNHAKQFKELGLPEQEAYRVPIANGRNVEIEFKERGDAAARKPDYTMFDLTSEQKVMTLLLTMDRPWILTSPIGRAVISTAGIFAGNAVGQQVLKQADKQFGMDETK